MSSQSKVTSYYSGKRKARDAVEPSAKRKRLDVDQHTFQATASTGAPKLRSTRRASSTASETLDALFSTPAASQPAESSASKQPCELFAPKVSYHGRARRNIGSVLSMTNNSRTKTKSSSRSPTNQDWFQPSETKETGAVDTTNAPKPTVPSKFAALAAPITFSPKATSADLTAAATSPRPPKSKSTPVKTSGQASSIDYKVDDELLPSSRLHHLAEPIKAVADVSSKTKLSPNLPLPFTFKGLQEKMEATDNVLCLRRQFGGSFTQLKDSVQRMTHKEYTTADIARITTVMPPAYVLSQEKVDKDYELHVKLNGAWREDLRHGRTASGMCSLPSGTKQVIQLKSERKEVFHDRLLSRVNDDHQRFLDGLGIKPDGEKPLTHWHPRFKVDSVLAIPCADLPQPPVTKAYSSASEVLKLSTVKSEKVGRALQAVVAASQTEPASSPRHVAAAKNSTLTPRQSEAKPKETSLKGVPASLLEKIRKREAEKALDVMTCPPEREKEIEMWDKLPELCRVMCSLFIAERRDVLELSVVLKGLRQSITSLQGSTPAHIEVLVTLLSDKLRKWISIVSVSSRPQRYVKLAGNAKSQVGTLLDALAKSRKEFDNEIHGVTAR